MDIFDNGKSAGICVDDSGIYEADMRWLRETCRDGFVDLIAQPDSEDVVMFPGMIIDPVSIPWMRFHQLWFKNKP